MSSSRLLLPWLCCKLCRFFGFSVVSVTIERVYRKELTEKKYEKESAVTSNLHVSQPAQGSGLHGISMSLVDYKSAGPPKLCNRPPNFSRRGPEDPQIWKPGYTSIKAYWAITADHLPVKTRQKNTANSNKLKGKPKNGKYKTEIAYCGKRDLDCGPGIKRWLGIKRGLRIGYKTLTWYETPTEGRV